MNTKKSFRNKKEFDNALDAVYHFHEIAYNTILKVLQKYGDIELTEQEQQDFTFCYLDWEGNYVTKAIRLDKTHKVDTFYLEAVSESGDEYQIEWDTINHDMIITEMLVYKVLEVKKAKKNK